MDVPMHVGYCISHPTLSEYSFGDDEKLVHYLPHTETRGGRGLGTRTDEHRLVKYRTNENRTESPLLSSW